MTREDIIRMARQAGHAIRNIDGEDEVMDGDNYHIQTELIERFAALVAAQEREKVAAWMIQRGYATGHGDTMVELLKELEWQIAERIAAEREACAKVCEEERNELLWREGQTLPRGEPRLIHMAGTASQCAAAIRARGEK